MLPLDHPDRIQITFDDRRLVANAGLLLPVTLAQHLGLRELVDHHLDLGNAPGRANAGDKMLTLVASALAGGDCIDDADVLRTGGTAQTLGCVVKAPSTLGTFLRSFRWGHVRQLDRVSRELLARAWAAGAGPGDAPFTIDLDSTICETYGLAKEGARDHGYTGKRGYHPLLAVAAGTGDVLMARLREGRANTARGAAHFLRETVGRVRYAGARGQLTVLAVRSNEKLWVWTDQGLCQVRADRLTSQVDELGWTRCSAGDGAKGPRVYDWAVVEIRPLGEPGKGYWLLARRSIAQPGELAYFVCFGPAGTALDELVRVAGTRWAIEECFEEAKGQVGLDQYEVRRWDGWYRHITLAMLAQAYLSVIKHQAMAPGEKGAATVPMKR